MCSPSDPPSSGIRHGTVVPMANPGRGMRLGFVEPHLARFGGIRRMVEFANRVAERSPPLKSTSAPVALAAMLSTLSVMALTSSREYIGVEATTASAMRQYSHPFLGNNEPPIRRLYD